MKVHSKVLVGILVVVALTAVAYGMKQDVGASSDTTVSVLAVVNGKAVTSADVDVFVATGLSKPVAVENAISRLLSAEAARALWPKDAEAVAEASAREALATYYVRKKLVDLQRGISDEEIARYYEINIKDEMYSGQALKYYLTQDAKDAIAMVEAVKKEPDAIGSKFSWVNKEGDHTVPPAATPYGLYQQVKTMQPGQYAGPFNVRDGLLFLKLEERKPGKRPEFAKVKDEIRAVVAQKKLEDLAKELRAKANIQLK